jgi:hypothetical protein
MSANRKMGTGLDFQAIHLIGEKEIFGQNPAAIRTGEN